MMSRWVFDMRTHLAVTSQKNQHEENRMRDIHVGKRGSEAASGEQDKLRKTVRFEQEALSASPVGGTAGTMHVSLEYLASGGIQGSARVRTFAEVRSC